MAAAAAAAAIPTAMAKEARPLPLPPTAPSSSSGTIITTTIRDALKLPSRQPKLALQVFLLIFLPFSLLVLLHSLLALPLLERVEDAYATPLLDPRDLRALVPTEAIFLVLFSAVSFSGLLLVVHGSALAYTKIDEKISIFDLQISVWSGWKMPLMVRLWVSVSALAYVIAVVVTVRTVSDFSVPGSWLVVVSAAVVYLWFVAIGNLALVVSVLEDEISGFRAVVTRSWRLMRGKGTDGFGVMLVLEMMSVPIYVIFSVTMMDDDDVLRWFTRLGFGYAATLVFCIAKNFVFVAFTVFYYECRKGKGEKLEMELGRRCYEAVPNAVVAGFDSSVP